MNPDFKKSGFYDGVFCVNDYLCYDFGPGPNWLPMYYFVNFNKGTMMVYLFALMCYYDNFSLGAWIYLSLHGNYGLIWTLKDRVFPDSGFERKTKTLSMVLAFVTVLGPYYMLGYWMMTGGEAQRNPSYERIFVAIQLYATGVVLMCLTDA